MMADPFYIFLLISALSFIGSLQPGPVNMTVLRITADHGRRNGFMAALGGCIPEIPYSIAAIALSDLLLRINFLDKILGYFVGIVLIILGLIMIIRRKQDLKTRLKTGHPFMNGLIMGILNPQLITYWLVIYLWLQSSGLFDTDHIISKAAFVAGTFTGAFILMWLVIRLSSGKYAHRFLFNRSKRDVIIGSILVLLGVWILARTNI